jgi:hypothetical protein
MIMTVHSKKVPRPKMIRIDNIRRVFYHTGQEYNVMYETVMEELVTVAWNQPTRIFADVPADQPMWAEKYDRGPNFDGSYDKWCVIHIHSAKDMNGAGWDRGKFGKGTTNVIAEEG